MINSNDKNTIFVKVDIEEAIAPHKKLHKPRKGARAIGWVVHNYIDSKFVNVYMNYSMFLSIQSLRSYCNDFKFYLFTIFILLCRITG